MRLIVSYLHWLLGTSAVFVLLERAFPWRREQAALRPGWLRDLGFVALNGHVFSLLTAALMGAVALGAVKGLHALGLRLEGSPVPRWPFAAQFAAFLILADFLQWCIHNLLHRVPWLWTFHKVHHSITTMDWIGNWRFHWMEILVYKALQWLPLAWLDASPGAVFAVAVVTTAWGDFNHANLDVGLGPARLRAELSPHAPLASRPVQRGRGGKELRYRLQPLGLRLRYGVLAPRPESRAPGLPWDRGDAGGLHGASPLAADAARFGRPLMALLGTLLFVLAVSPAVPVGFSGVQPQLAGVGRKVALVFGEGQTIYVAGSSDGGRTFASPVALPSHGALALGRHRGPRISVAGEALVVTAILGAKREGGDLFAWRSTDDGRTWSSPVRLNSVADSAREGLHGLGGAGGLVMAAWLDLRLPGTHIWGAVSRDAGATWSGDRLVYESPSGSTCECCHPSVAVSPNGEISVMFRNSLDGSRDLYLTTSRDGGITFEAATKLGHGTWKLDGCPMDGGALAANEQGAIATVWRREQDLFFARPGQPELLVGAGADPAIALGPRGEWAVAYRDTRGVSVTDGGSRGAQTLGPGGQAPAILALDDGSWLAAWEREGRVFVAPVAR